MKVITLARKPLDGTVASNVLSHGCGGINVDGTRIDLNGDYKSKSNGRPSLTGLGDNYNAKEANQPDTVGRWPANLILQHLEGCKVDGTRTVRCGNPTRKDGTIRSGDNEIYSKRGDAPLSNTNYANENGKEIVPNWICEPGCPVKELDTQSVAGGMHSAGSSRSAKREAGKTGMFPMDGDGHRFGDSGGASRFFKQVKNET